MSKSAAIVRWMRLNGLFLGLAFLAVGLLTGLFPEAMLELFGRWATLLSSVGARTAAELGSPAEIFWHIVGRNSIAVLIFFLTGLVLQAPVALIFGGAFYALIAFLAPFTLGRPFGWNDWLLIALEMTTLTLVASLGMALAGDLFKVPPTLGSWWEYSRRSWKSLGFDLPGGWRETLSGWARTLLLGLLVTAVLLFSVAWYETFGY